MKLIETRIVDRTLSLRFTDESGDEAHAAMYLKVGLGADEVVEQLGCLKATVAGLAPSKPFILRKGTKFRVMAESSYATYTPPTGDKHD